MNPRWTYRCMRATGRSIKRTYGSTVDPEERWCWTSVWGVDGMGRDSFWDRSRDFCRRMDMQPTIRSAGGRRGMRGGGGLRDDNFLVRGRLNTKNPLRGVNRTRMLQLLSPASSGPS